MFSFSGRMTENPLSANDEKCYTLFQLTQNMFTKLFNSNYKASKELCLIFIDYFLRIAENVNISVCDLKDCARFLNDDGILEKWSKVPIN
ncbi:MAG: hypothetical protein LBB39_03165 [Mycoplasmataceae bacterium]|jgi:hypothetical protein|nr:hypothetical protein [Mycoplasmataceae bacterium]